jgi:hypothetical protein
VKVDRSNVAATVTRTTPSAESAARYAFTIRLDEKAGVATRLTRFKLNGDDFTDSLASWFGSTAIPAKGSIQAALATDYPYPPGPQIFEFWGTDDATGRTWYTTTTVTF